MLLLLNGMGQISDVPKFPVVDKAPSLSRVISNFNATDCGTVLAFTALSYPFGVWAGGKTKSLVSLRLPTAACAAFVGGLGGFCVAMESSAGRLMGFTKNDDEVDRKLREKKRRA